MPSSIPYDPTLALGNIVPRAKLDLLEKVSGLQTEIDAAEDRLNAMITLKRSFDMTRQELLDMGIDVAEVTKKSGEVGQQISDAAKHYADVNVKNQPDIQNLKVQLRGVNDTIESPIDYVKSTLKSFPLNSDSVKFNAQFFKFNSMTQTAENYTSSIKKFVTMSVGDIIGDDLAYTQASTAQRQVSDQLESHKVEGTLVVTAACTHRQATLFAPLVLDVDKAIRVWNATNTPAEFLDANDPQSMKSALETARLEATGMGPKGKLEIISGASFGSSFVGMIHIVQTENTNTAQSVSSKEGDFEAEGQLRVWDYLLQGADGNDSASSEDLKSLLSRSDLTSHLSVITMGMIPSVKSSTVMMSIQKFTDFTPDKMMEKLVLLQNATSTSRNSVETAANEMRVSQQMNAFEATQIKNALSSLSEIDDKTNATFDIKSLLVAYEDYITKASAANAAIGVPVNYFITPITRAELAKLWIDKYIPKKMLRVGTDAGTSTAGADASAPASTPADSGASTNGSGGGTADAPAPAPEAAPAENSGGDGTSN